MPRPIRKGSYSPTPDRTFASPPPCIDLQRVPAEARDLAQRLTSKAPDIVVWELKLFACRVRAAIMEEVHATIAEIASADETPPTTLVTDYLANGKGALSAVRDVLGPQKLRTLSFEPVDPEVAKTQAWVDEYLSRVLELAFIHLAKVVEAEDGSNDNAQAAIAAAVDEARYRQSHNEGPVSSSDGSIHDLEQIERRQHALKRFTSSVLWLDVQTREGYTVALHIFHALAAGIAMAFAVIIAVLFGQPNAPGKLGMWAAVVVVAYMGKDRPKSNPPERFRLGRRHPTSRPTLDREYAGRDVRAGGRRGAGRVHRS